MTARSVGIGKPLPPDLVIPHDRAVETRWDAMPGEGRDTPIDRFFVRNHTVTPRIDVDSWRLRVFGSGLRGRPTLDRAVEFDYRDLIAMPARTVRVLLECTGNGRVFFGIQQHDPKPGTAWGLGGVGVATWKGVPLRSLLRRAGVGADAVAVLPRGLDPEFVEHGVNHGRVRRPLPVRKAMDDVLVAYEMNGEPLPPDHGYPVRLVVPGWVGVASTKWLGDIEVSNSPLSSPWSDLFYQLDGDPLSTLVPKSAFELPWNAELARGRTHVLYGRSWSGAEPIRRVEISADGGRHWRPVGFVEDGPWARWRFDWQPRDVGRHVLMARATDKGGNTQPDRAAANPMGYLFGAVVRHPVIVG